MKGWSPHIFRMEIIYLTEEFLTIKLLKIVTVDTEKQGRRSWSWHFVLTMRLASSRLKRESAWRKKFRGNSTGNFVIFPSLTFHMEGDLNS